MGASGSQSPSQRPAPPPVADCLGKVEADWARLFNELMLMTGRKQYFWGAVAMPPAVMRGFEQLQADARQMGWWPTAKQMAAVRWRYAQGREHPAKGCLGGHRLKTGAGYFVAEFYQVATECETEYDFCHRKPEALPLFAGAGADREAFLAKPLAEWTAEEMDLALGWGRLEEAAALAELERRRKLA